VRFQFLSVLSHELKSPINAIEGYLNIMQDKQAGDDIDSYQTMIGRSQERIKGMRTLIMDLLDLTRIESGKKKRNLVKTDISEIAKISMHSMEPLAIQKSVKLNFENGHPVYFETDPTEMEIILNNLLSNAVKYNKDGGEVLLGIKDDLKNIEITVEDNGIGMSPEDVEKLFQEFVRIRNSKTKDITGSGLGLSIVKKLVDLNRGEIHVESYPEKGTKFTVTLPKFNR